MQDCGVHKDAMDPECIREKMNNVCNKLTKIRNLLISHVISLFVNSLFSQGYVLFSLHKTEILMYSDYFEMSSR